MIRKIPLGWVALWSLFLVMGLGISAVQAGSTDADGVYSVTITKVEFSTDGTNFITVFEGSKLVNIAAIDAGAVAAGLIGGVSIPAGTYTDVRWTVGSDLLLKGYINSGADTTYTNGATFDTNVGSTDTPGNDFATSTFTIPGGSRSGTTSGLSIEVGQGKNPVCSVSFDTSGVISAGPSINAPVVDITSR